MYIRLNSLGYSNVNVVFARPLILRGAFGKYNEYFDTMPLPGDSHNKVEVYLPILLASVSRCLLCSLGRKCEEKQTEK